MDSSISTNLGGRGGRPVPMFELSSHNSRYDCWVAVRGQVYDVTSYLNSHPGGSDKLMQGAGRDATAMFEGVHGYVNAHAMLAHSHIGPLS